MFRFGLKVYFAPNLLPTCFTYTVTLNDWGCLAGIGIHGTHKGSPGGKQLKKWLFAVSIGKQLVWIFYKPVNEWYKEPSQSWLIAQWCACYRSPTYLKLMNPLPWSMSRLGVLDMMWTTKFRKLSVLGARQFRKNRRVKILGNQHISSHYQFSYTISF